MNKVFAHEDDTHPLTPEGMVVAAKELNENVRVEASDYPERIEGTLCDCRGEGEFVLEPPEEGQKRYMKCRICGKYSHL